MTTLEEIKKKYTELGELIAVLEKESTIYATSNNWRVLFFEIAISTYCISMNDLKQKNRSETIVMVRQIFMFLLRQNDRLYYAEIGRMLHKDHSTVMWGVKKSIEYIQVNDHRFMRVYENFKHLNFGK